MLIVGLLMLAAVVLPLPVLTERATCRR